MKKNLAILAVVALGAALVGCGPKDEAAAGTTTAAPATTSTATPPATTETPKTTA